MNRDQIAPLIRAALDEDLGDQGDVTSMAIFSGEQGRFRLVSKDAGVVAGADVFTEVFAEVDAEVEVRILASDGTVVKPGDVVARVRGSVVSVLTAERVALNFLSFLSGIATETRRYVSAASGKTRILDTRKTLPGFRWLSKYAVRVGGGENHRAGLHDMVLIKDNHIDTAGSITTAVERVKRQWGERFRIEVECRSVEDVRQALDAHVDVVMLDNMEPEDMKQAVNLPHPHTEFEISGNVTLERIPVLAALGADSISVGALTHSVTRFDFSLLAEEST